MIQSNIEKKEEYKSNESKDITLDSKNKKNVEEIEKQKIELDLNIPEQKNENLKEIKAEEELVSEKELKLENIELNSSGKKNENNNFYENKENNENKKENQENENIVENNENNEKKNEKEENENNIENNVENNDNVNNENKNEKQENENNIENNVEINENKKEKQENENNIENNVEINENKNEKQENENDVENNVENNEKEENENNIENNVGNNDYVNNENKNGKEENENNIENKEYLIIEVENEKGKKNSGDEERNIIDKGNNKEIMNKQNEKKNCFNEQQEHFNENIKKDVGNKDFINEIVGEIKKEREIIINEKEINNDQSSDKEESEFTNSINEINYPKIVSTPIKELNNSKENKISDTKTKESNGDSQNKGENPLNITRIFNDLEPTSHIQLEYLTKKKFFEISHTKQLKIFPSEEEFNENTKLDFLKKIKPKGLRNLGSCCYMNATLQCFYHIKELTYYFLDNKKYIKRKKGLIANGLLDLIEGLSRKDKLTYYSPIKFRDNLLEVDDLFEGYEGKDSKDLVETILYNLQDELVGDSDFPDLSIDQRQERLKYLDLYYNNSKVRSIVTDLFNFEFKTTRSCYECGVKYYSISNENKLIFNLESVYNSCYGNKTFKNKIVTLDDCLSYFALGNSYIENVSCKYCKKNSSILSFNSFSSLPEIFIFINSRGEKEKFECKVDFNEELDLKDLYIKIEGITEERTTKYTILGGTILYGSNGYGHTVAFCKHFDDKYYIFNDSSFYESTFDEIRKQKIYLLFYQKNKE